MHDYTTYVKQKESNYATNEMRFQVPDYVTQAKYSTVTWGDSHQHKNHKDGLHQPIIFLVVVK